MRKDDQETLIEIAIALIVSIVVSFLIHRYI
jgi:hypothetical protein